MHVASVLLYWLTVAVLSHSTHSLFLDRASRNSVQPSGESPQVQPPLANSPIPSVGSTCRSYGSLHYTAEAGDPDTTGTNPSLYKRFEETCPLGSQVMAAKLSSVERILAGIDFTCDDAASTKLSVQTHFLSQAEHSQISSSSLALSRGQAFSAASYYASYIGYPIITTLALSSSDGKQVLAGIPLAKSNQNISISLPPSATIVGLGGGENGYFISLFFVFCTN